MLWLVCSLLLVLLLLLLLLWLLVLLLFLMLLLLLSADAYESYCSRVPAFERSAAVGLGPRTRLPMNTLFGDLQVYKAFKWTTEDRRLIKAVKTKLQSLLAASTGLHKTAIEWGEVKFLVDGVYIPFKKPSSYASAYAWWYRTVAKHFIDAMKVTAGQFRPVEASGQPSSSTGPEPSSSDAAGSQPSASTVGTVSTVPHEASSRAMLRIASRIPDGSFPGIPSLKLLRSAHIHHFCVGLRGSDRTTSSESQTQL
jgi:hypothetical protein